MRIATVERKGAITNLKSEYEISLMSFVSNGLKDILMYNKPRIMKTNKKLFLLILSSLERK